MLHYATAPKGGEELAEELLRIGLQGQQRGERYLKEGMQPSEAERRVLDELIAPTDTEVFGVAPSSSSRPKPSPLPSSRAPSAGVLRRPSDPLDSPTFPRSPMKKDDLLSGSDDALLDAGPPPTANQPAVPRQRQPKPKQQPEPAPMEMIPPSPPPSRPRLVNQRRLRQPAGRVAQQPRMGAGPPPAVGDRRADHHRPSLP